MNSFNRISPLLSFCAMFEVRYYFAESVFYYPVPKQSRVLCLALSVCVYICPRKKTLITVITIISFIKRQCVEGLQWRGRTVAIVRANSEQMCQIKSLYLKQPMNQYQQHNCSENSRQKVQSSGRRGRQNEFWLSVCAVTGGRTERVRSIPRYCGESALGVRPL